MIRYAALRYRIEHWSTWREVDGYAILLPAPFSRLRFCVRCNSSGGWLIDHYDSGRLVTGPGLYAAYGYGTRSLAYVRKWAAPRQSRTAAAEWLPRWLAEAQRTGVLRAAYERNGYGWCLDEAGL